MAWDLWPLASHSQAEQEPSWTYLHNTAWGSQHQAQPGDALHGSTGENALSHLRLHLTMETFLSGPSARDGTPSLIMPLASRTNVLWNSPHVETTHNQAGYSIWENKICRLQKPCFRPQKPRLLSCCGVIIRGGFWSSMSRPQPCKASYFIYTWGSLAAFSPWTLKEGRPGEGRCVQKREALSSQILAGHAPHVCLDSEVRRRWRQLRKLRRRENPHLLPWLRLSSQSPESCCQAICLKESCWNINTSEKRIPKGSTPFPQPKGTRWPEIPGHHPDYLKVTKGGTWASQLVQW